MMRIVDAGALSRAAPGSGEDHNDAVLLTGTPAAGSSSGAPPSGGATVVAAIDGLGGPGRGDRATKLVLAGIERKTPLIDKLARATERDRTSGARLALIKSIERVLGEVHAEIAALQDSQLGATLALAVFTAGYAHVAHVGAVRAYLLRDGRLRALTEDHTLGMARVRSGSMSPEEYQSSPLRRRLYQALGTGADIDVDVASVVLADRDVLLLCTDGVHGALDDDTLRDCLSLKTAEQAANALCDAARAAGSEDAASAVVVRIASEAAPEEIDALARTLASTSLFRDLSESERLLVAPYLDRIDLDNGDQLFAEGDPGDAFYVIVDGHVRVTRGGTPLTEIGPGGGFGELCLAGPRIARSASVTAVGPTVVLGLTRDRFHEVVARRPAIGTRLLSRSLDLIGERLRDLTERLSTVEALAVGEIRPGDLALRTAMVLAARGDWPPADASGEHPAVRLQTNAPREVEAGEEDAPALVPPPMPTARQRRRVPTGSTPVSPARIQARARSRGQREPEAEVGEPAVDGPLEPGTPHPGVPAPDGPLGAGVPAPEAPGPLTSSQREPSRPLENLGPGPQVEAQREHSRPLQAGTAGPAPGSQREPTGPVDREPVDREPVARPHLDADLAPQPLGDLPRIVEPTVAIPDLPATGEEDTVLNKVVRRPISAAPPVPPLSALRRPMYRPDGEPLDPADIRIDIDDLGPDDETEM
jgi:PPM family protein phosphatase